VARSDAGVKEHEMVSQMPVTGFLGSTLAAPEPVGVRAALGGIGHARAAATGRRSETTSAPLDRAGRSSFAAALGRAAGARRGAGTSAARGTAANAATHRALSERAGHAARQLRELVHAVRRAEAGGDSPVPSVSSTPGETTVPAMDGADDVALDPAADLSPALAALDLRGTKLGAVLAALGQALDNEADSPDVLSGIVADTAQTLAADPELLAAAETLVAAAQAFGLLAPALPAAPATPATAGAAVTPGTRELGPTEGLGIGPDADMMGRGAVRATPGTPEQDGGPEAIAPETAAAVAGSNQGAVDAGDRIDGRSAAGDKAVRILAEVQAALASEQSTPAAAAPGSEPAQDASDAGKDTRGVVAAPAVRPEQDVQGAVAVAALPADTAGTPETVAAAFAPTAVAASQVAQPGRTTDAPVSGGKPARSGGVSRNGTALAGAADGADGASAAEGAGTSDAVAARAPVAAPAGTRSSNDNGGATPDSGGDDGTDLVSTVPDSVSEPPASAAPTTTAQPGAGQPPRSAVAGAADVAPLETSGRVPAFDATSVRDQIASVVIRQARLVRDGNAHEMTLRLEPGTLGTVHVRLTVLDGGLSVGLSAASADTHRTLESALPQLRATLLDAGLRLERLDVGVGDNGERDRRGSGGNAFANSDGSGSGDSGRSPDRRYGSDGQQGEAFAALLFDDDGRPFAPAPRGTRSRDLVSPIAHHAPTTVAAEALRPALGSIALARGGYGAYGVLRRSAGNARNR
jgi:flagellar hook-length control protein FliK